MQVVLKLKPEKIFISSKVFTFENGSDAGLKEINSPWYSSNEQVININCNNDIVFNVNTWIEMT